MKKEITELRNEMRKEGIDVYYVPAGDPHGSEYVNDHYKACEFLSGLLAENETLVVTDCGSDRGAYIWTDGRFFLQAQRELAGSGIKLMKMEEEGVPTVQDFLRNTALEECGSHPDRTFVIGFDGDTAPASFDSDLMKILEGCSNAEIKWDKDLTAGFWKDRPEIVPSKLWELPLTSAGKTAEEKVCEIREAMTAKGADCLVLTDLSETAWLLNMRGGDIAYTPVFFSYIIVTMDSVILYVMDGALSSRGSDSSTPNGLPESLSFVEVRNYGKIYEDIAALPQEWKIWMDLSSANYSLFMRAPDRNNIVNETTPAALLKTVKNETEIRSTINAHIKDGTAVTRFIRWIKDVADKDPQTEISAADHLEALRREQEGCFDISFSTISGYGPNGAIIHYSPSAETNLEIKPEGFLLVDSGGQYIDGTTDITRTIAVGPLTHEMIDGYTRVLKGHIALSRYVVTPETTHKELDDSSRKALREAGLDYGHGVSHGVGHVLTVHEGPAGIKKKDEPVNLKAGMIISNEPGLYMAGKFGIRIENEILMKEDGKGNLISEPVTFVPYEREAIDTGLLTSEEIEWLNSYHARVRELLLPRMEGADAEFLIRETEPLYR